MTGRRALIVAGLVLVSFGMLQAVDVTGKWTAKFTTQVGEQEYTYEFVAKGTTLYLIDQKSAAPSLVRNATEGRIKALAVNKSDQVALGHSSNKVQVRAIASGQSTTVDVPGGVGPMAFSPDGANLAIASKDSIRIVNLQSPNDAREIKTGSRLVAYAPGGGTLAALSNDTSNEVV